MKPKTKGFVKSVMLELLVYSVLVAIYFLAVLHFLGGWLFELFSHRRGVYAGVALALIIGQGAFLEALTTALLRFIQGDRGR